MCRKDAHRLNSLLCLRKHFPNLQASCTLLNGSELTAGENNPSTFLQLLAIHVTPLSLITSANFTPVKDLIKSSVGSAVPSGAGNEPFCVSDSWLSCLCWLEHFRGEMWILFAAEPPVLLSCLSHAASGHMGGSFGKCASMVF